MTKNLWNDKQAPKGDGLASLRYRSNLFGADRSVCNIYGGNTSAKLIEKDHLGNDVEVLWVKGSGSDVSNITEEGFAGLRMADIMPLLERQDMSDEEMVAYLAHTVHAIGRPRQSIETLLHAFTPFKHVDHTHPDSVISIASSPNGKKLAKELWGDRAIWLDYVRPGFMLSKWIGEAIRANPKAELVVMGKHGLVSWGNSSKESYNNTISIIQEADKFIKDKAKGKKIFVSRGIKLPAKKRQDSLSEILPILRGLISQERPMILQNDSSKRVLEFVNSEVAKKLSQVGAACPDHLVHTKMQPLFIDWQPEQGLEKLKEKLPKAVADYVKRYQKYFDKHASKDDKLLNPYPRVILIPGIGMITAGADAQAADVSAQLYHRAINAMEGSETVGKFRSLSAAESFAIEYWPLELYKMSLKPKPKEMAGKVAIVTGAASGIGRATALRLAEDHGHIAIFDINLEGAQDLAKEINETHGFKRAKAIHCDVTSEKEVEKAFKEVVLEYGGVDTVVSNAGISISAPIEETSLENWEKMNDIMGKGYFLVSREAFKIWKKQNIGGSLIFVASKNSVVAGKNAAAYSAVKAAELHLARCLAEEGGGFGIRVNSVMPDAVLRGSNIWDGGWRENRAKAYGIKPEELDDFYKNRTTLKVAVYPENIAEAISFLAGPRSSRTTGGVLTVDGGVAAAYLR